MSEEWKPVVGYEEAYSVSNLGRVRLEKDRWNKRAGSFLKQTRDRDGYLLVGLRLLPEDYQSMRRVSRLVLEAFEREPRPGEQANHKSGDKADNRLENLEWTTGRENVEHAIRVLGKRRDGAFNPAAKLTEADVLALRERAAGGATFTALAETFGVSVVMAKNIATGLSWKTVGGPRVKPPGRGRR